MASGWWLTDINRGMGRSIKVKSDGTKIVVSV